MRTYRINHRYTNAELFNGPEDTLSKADLSGADLSGADLTGAIFAPGWVIQKKEQH